MNSLVRLIMVVCHKFYLTSSIESSPTHTRGLDTMSLLEVLIILTHL